MPTSMRGTRSRADARKLALAGFLACTGLIVVALYLQYVRHLDPCPLCMLQRVLFIGVGLVFLIAAIAGPAGAWRKVLGGLAAVLATVGAGFATRHVWLQWHPPENEACSADLFTMFDRLPFFSVIQKALYATGDCAKVDWTLFRLSIAEWSLLWFVVLLGLALVYGRWKPRRSNW